MSKTRNKEKNVCKEIKIKTINFVTLPNLNRNKRVSFQLNATLNNDYVVHFFTNVRFYYQGKITKAIKTSINCSFRKSNEKVMRELNIHKLISKWSHFNWKLQFQVTETFRFNLMIQP